MLVVLGGAAVAAGGGGSRANRGGLQWLSSYDFDPVEQAGMLNLGLIHCDTKTYRLLQEDNVDSLYHAIYATVI